MTAYLNVLSQNLASLERAAAANRRAGHHVVAARQQAQATALLRRISALAK